MIYFLIMRGKFISKVVRFTQVIHIDRTSRKLYNLYKRLLFVQLIHYHNFKKNKLKLIVGSSSTHQRGWIATEQSWLDISKSYDWDRYFRPEQVDAILAEHVFEHIDFDDLHNSIENVFRYLRPGAYIRIAVPDGNHPSDTYINHVKPGGTGDGSNDHKVLYTYNTLSAQFTRAGFIVTLIEYYDEYGIFHKRKWSAADGFIERSLEFDKRNYSGINKYSSIIIDATKPEVINISLI